jgi:predicted nuclease of restriction endonuclease-like (RecB) superfamily
MDSLQNKDNNELFDHIKVLLTEAKKSIVRNINHTMVYTYYEIGRMIVDDEQKGKYRAEYGMRVLEELSGRLTKEFGKGFSQRNLEQMRQFYLTYAIPQTVSAKLQVPQFQLSWSHYLKLMRMEDIAEREFYEIEAANNQWSLRELRRQYDTALYQRLVLSKDKQGILKLSKKGQTIEKPEDAIKDPYIIEFIGLPENAKYSETELEHKLIDKLEHFMLELGKGFTFVGRQVRFTFDERHFRVDLVFFNRILQCFVLIDLKIGDLDHQDIG